MPAASAIGGALLAFGPSAVFFFGFVSPRSQLLVMSILSAFVWVLTISVAGLIWAIIPPLQGATGFHAPIAVLLQEAGRFALAKIHVRAEPFILQLLPAADPMGWNDLSVALAAGVGFGTAHAVTMHAGAIIASGGIGDAVPGVVGSCPASLWVISPVQALLEVVAHMALMVVAFDVLRRSRSPALAADTAEAGSAVIPGSAIGSVGDSESDTGARDAAATGTGAATAASTSASSSCCCASPTEMLRWGGIIGLHLLWSLPSLASATVKDACLWAIGVQLVAALLAVAWAGFIVTSDKYYPAQRASRAEVLASAERSRRVREAQAEAARLREEEARRARSEAAAAARATEAGESVAPAGADGVRHR